MGFDWVALFVAALGGVLALAGWQRWRMGDNVGAVMLAFMVVSVIAVLIRSPN